MTLDSVGPTQSSVFSSEAFFSILPKCLFVIIVVHAYFIHISQGSIETHLHCSGIYNNHIVANCPQSVPVKEF